MKTPEDSMPILHLNGSGIENLSDDRCEALAALGDAAEKLCKVAPNGRDFYPDPGRMQRYEKVHRDRARRLYELIEELTDEVERLHDLSG